MGGGLVEYDPDTGSKTDLGALIGASTTLDQRAA